MVTVAFGSLTPPDRSSQQVLNALGSIVSTEKRSDVDVTVPASVKSLRMFYDGGGR